MNFHIELLLKTDDQLYNQLKLKYGLYTLKKYSYILLFNNKYLFSLEQLYKIFSKEIANQYDCISYNKFSDYLGDENSSYIFLHNINANTKTELKNNLISIKQDNNQYKIVDLIEDDHYILSNDILQQYNLYICYLNDKYALLSFTNQIHESLGAKDLLDSL